MSNCLESEGIEQVDVPLAGRVLRMGLVLTACMYYDGDKSVAVAAALRNVSMMKSNDVEKVDERGARTLNLVERLGRVLDDEEDCQVVLNALVVLSTDACEDAAESGQGEALPFAELFTRDVIRHVEFMDLLCATHNPPHTNRDGARTLALSVFDFTQTEAANSVTWWYDREAEGVAGKCEACLVQAFHPDGAPDNFSFTHDAACAAMAKLAKVH